MSSGNTTGSQDPEVAIKMNSPPSEIGKPVNRTNVLLSLVVAAQFVLASLDYSGSISWSVWNSLVIAASKEVSRKPKDYQFFAHFSHIASYEATLPQSGATDLTIPFKKLKDVVDQARKQGNISSIHVKIFTDGGQNWSQVSNMLNKCYEACEYAKTHGVTLLFTIVMVGNYIRYNCWVSVLAFFCKMYQHSCWIVYKESPGKIHQIQQNPDGSTTSEEVDDTFGGHTGENLFANLIKSDAFFDLCSSHTALAYAAAFLNSSECNGMDKSIRAKIQSFWRGILDAYPEENPAESSAFVFPQSSQISLEELKKRISTYFGAPPRLRVDSKIGMQSLFDYFKQKLADSDGELYVSFAEMVTSGFHEEWLNNRTVAAEIPSDQLLSKSLKEPAFARLLEKMVNLSTINIVFYNSINNFVRVYFDKISSVEAVSVTSEGIKLASFLDAVICAIETKQPFFPRMKIGITQEEQNAYARFITELNKWCIVSSMSQYGDDGVSLKQILHLVLHNVFCQAVNSGFHGKQKFDLVKEVLHFDDLEKSGFLFDLISASSVSRYFDRLFSNIVADHGLGKKMPQQTEVSKYQLVHSAFLLEIHILLKLKKSSPNFQKFCESFSNLYRKMLSEGVSDCNPKRDWKSMQCCDPHRLAFAAVLGLYPTEFDDFLNRQGNEDLKIQMQTVHASRVLDCHCKKCRTYEWVEITTTFTYFSQWRGEYITHDSTYSVEITDANRTQYSDPKYTLNSRPRTQEELKDKPKCEKCYEPEKYEFKIADDAIMQDPRFRTWLIQVLIIRGLDTYVDYIEKNGADKGKKMGKLDSCLTKLYVEYQKTEINGCHFHSVWHLRRAFDETGYVMREFMELRESLDESTRPYFTIDSSQLDSEFTWEMGKYFDAVVEAQEKTKGAIHWSCVLSAFSEEFEYERKHLQEMHAQEPCVSHGISDVCHVCQFRIGSQMISAHEAKCLGFPIPLALLIPIASFVDGVFTLGTINECIKFRMTKQNFINSYPRFMKEFNPQGILKNWWNFGSRGHSIQDIMSRRADDESFMILLKLEDQTHYFVRFNKNGDVIRVFRESSMLFKEDDVVNQSLIAVIIPRIEAGVKALLIQ